MLIITTTASSGIITISTMTQTSSESDAELSSMFTIPVETILFIEWAMGLPS